jgi:hypothetical protein
MLYGVLPISASAWAEGMDRFEDPHRSLASLQVCLHMGATVECVRRGTAQQRFLNRKLSTLHSVSVGASISGTMDSFS